MCSFLRRPRAAIAVLIALGLAVASMGNLKGQSTSVERGLTLSIPLGLIEPDIPLNDELSAEKIALGEKLFFDSRLSKTEKMSCATCHDPRHAFAERHSKSINAAGRQLRRNAPSVLNAGFLTTMGWDGRFKTLEDQIREPFSKDGDMALEIDEALERIMLFPDYANLFEQAFQSQASVSTLSRAIAAYQRSLLSGSTRWDEFLFGQRESALSEAERAGWELFIGKANCIGCHDVFHPMTTPLGGQIALFTDHRFHNLGVGYKNGRMTDAGRYYVTQRIEDRGAFKTPMLRNVALTTPYMHDGSLRTLREVVDFYDQGGIHNPNLSSAIRPLLLKEDEKHALVAFLRSLTDPALRSLEPPN